MGGHLTRDVTGHLNKLANGRIARDIDSSCDEGVYLTLPECIVIQGYVDGDFTIADAAGEFCTECANSGNPAWDGTYTKTMYFGTKVCGWGTGRNQASSPTRNVSVSGKKLQNGPTLVEFTPETCTWIMGVYCENGGGQKIWVGRKFANPETPLGIYSRVLGCDATANLTIIACP